MTSTRNLITLGVLAGTLFVASGCTVHGRMRVRTPPPPRAQATVTVQQPTPQPATTTAVVQAPQPTLATGVTVVAASCTQGAQELCNGLDDNCDGQIDEGCGWSSGSIQVTLAWQGAADIDLYVTDPQGNQIFYQQPQAASGGHLDHDGRGGCRGGGENATVENVFWDSATPPPGTYQVALQYYSECNAAAGPTTATVSIAVGGQIIGAYNYTLRPEERVNLASFTLQ